MSLRARFIMVVLLTLMAPLLVSQIILVKQFFAIQEANHRSHSQTLLQDIQDNLEKLKSEAVFNAEVIAKSARLNNYINHKQFRLPTVSAYRALLKSLAIYLQTFPHYKHIYFLQPDGQVDVDFDLSGDELPPMHLPDQSLFLSQVQAHQTAFQWFTHNNKDHALRLMVAEAVYPEATVGVTPRATMTPAGYLVISISLDPLKYVGTPSELPGMPEAENLFVLRFKDEIFLHSDQIDLSLKEHIQHLPTINPIESDASGTDYLVESLADEAIRLEAYTSRDLIHTRARPALIQNILTTLLQLVVIGGLFYFVLNRWLITPLQQAYHLTRSLTHGQWLRRPIPALTPAVRQDEMSQLIDAMYDMSDKLEQTTQALDAKRLQAEQADRLKSEFLANMSHEFRTPVNIIVGVMNRLEKHLTEPRHQEYLGTAKKEALHLVKQIDELILLSELEANKHTLISSEFYWPDLLQRCLASAYAPAQAKGLNLQQTHDDALDCIVLGDSQKITQIINILLGNAVKFTDQGSVTLSARCLPQEDQRMHVQIAISDTGPGIPPEALPHLRDAFTQLDGSIVRRHGGLGLGLAVCKGLLTLMHSQLSIRSTAGHGSTFSFELTLSPVQDAAHGTK